MNQVLKIAAGVFLGVLLVWLVLNFQAVKDHMTGDDETKRMEEWNAEANRKAIQADLEYRIQKANRENGSK